MELGQFGNMDSQNFFTLMRFLLCNVPLPLEGRIVIARS